MKALGLDQLGIEDLIELAQELWDRIETEIESAPPTEAQRAELKRRLAHSIARPDAVIAWDEVKALALARARR